VNTLRDIPVQVTPEEVLRAQYGQRGRSVQGWLVEAAEEAIAMSRPLVAPAAVWEMFPVREVTGQHVLLSADGDPQGVTARLTVGPRVDLLAPARQVMAAVYTIGPVLERRVEELNGAGEATLAYMLDCVGVMALGAVGDHLRVLAEEAAMERGWGVGPALSPGSLVGWDLRGQRDLCALLPLEEIGVRLNKQCVLVPHKSVSMLIGMGPGYDSAHVGSVCRFCSLADHCWRRREDGE
jgi:hypothetical protein